MIKEKIQKKHITWHSMTSRWRYFRFRFREIWTAYPPSFVAIGCCLVYVIKIASSVTSWWRHENFTDADITLAPSKHVATKINGETGLVFQIWVPQNWKIKYSWRHNLKTAYVIVTSLFDALHWISDINHLVFNMNVFKLTCENFTTIGAHVFKKKTKNC